MAASAPVKTRKSAPGQTASNGPATVPPRCAGDADPMRRVREITSD